MANKRIKDLTNTATDADIASGNYFALDGIAGTKKLNSTTLLTKTAQNALAGNVAPAFDPAKPNDAGGYAYYTGTNVSYEGKNYVFIANHFSGAWNPVEVEQKPLSETITTEGVGEAVNAWLDEHPEATTTVQDGSLTEVKFSNTLKLQTIKDYVTPEMFGAEGDGVTDDTAAFNEMFNNGNYFVINGTYKISSVSVPNKDIVIVGKGNILVTGNGLEFSSPLKHKVIRGLTFELEENATCAIVFSGNASTSVTNTLCLQGISVKAQALSNKIGISIDTENEALLENIALYGCCLKITNSINPSIVNLICRHSHIGILNANGIQDSGATACGLKVINATILGCTIGIKAVEVDSIQVSNSMIDYNDYPIVIVGCGSPFFTNCYISSRKGLPCIHSCANNSNEGIYGGNGFNTEPTSYLNVSQCTLVQHADGEYSESMDYSAIEIYGGNNHALSSIVIPFCRKSGIDIRDIVNSVLSCITINSNVDGSKALISYKNGVIEDEITNTYRDFKTRLPIFVHYARTDISAQSFATSYSGYFVSMASESATTRTIVTNCNQGIGHVIVSSNDPSATVTYTISGSSVTFNVSAHSINTNISFIAFGKLTNVGWT